MIRLKKPKKDGYEGAYLDEEGKPQKIECDVLETVHYVVDQNTLPMPSIVMTYARCDSKKNFQRGGPLTQHYITGTELADIVDSPAGITILNMEQSTLNTGIPSAGILKEDLEFDPSLPLWNSPAEQLRKIAEELKNPPRPQFPVMPGMTGPTGEQS